MNVMGLVLYLTREFILCVIVAVCLSVIACVITAIYIKRTYFSDKSIFNESPEEVQELELHWDYNKKKNFSMMKDESNHEESKKKIGLPENLLRIEDLDEEDSTEK